MQGGVDSGSSTSKIVGAIQENNKEKRVRAGICICAVVGTNRWNYPSNDQFGVRIGVPATNLDVN